MSRVVALLLSAATLAAAAAEPGDGQPPPHPDSSCEYLPGPRVLAVDADGAFDVRFVRDGREILVGSEGMLVPCSGEMPTVTNVDRVRVRGVRLGVTVDQSRGRFVPGATAEPQGSEIEFEVGMTGDAYGALRITGTSRPDRIDLGTAGPGTVAANLNVGADRRAKDADVVLRTGPRPAHVMVNPRGGGDLIRARPPNGGLGPLQTDSLYVRAGAGNDAVWGTRGRDLLFGDTGADRLIAGAGADRLVPGLGDDGVFAGRGADRIDLASPGRQIEVPDGGRDFVAARDGNDFIESRDARGDELRCGSGRDHARADRRDLLFGCER
jgi:hypothetical protein